MFQIIWEHGFWVGFEAQLTPSVEYLVNRGYTAIVEACQMDDIDPMDAICDPAKEEAEAPF